MKKFFNLFLILFMPLSILFTALAVVYYSIDFEFSKSIKLGILTGVLSSLIFSIIITPTILILRVVRSKKAHTEILSADSHNVSKAFIQKPIVYESKTPSTQKNEMSIAISKPDLIEEKLMLLMDNELAYEVSLASVNHQKIGNIIYKNKEEGVILIRTEEREIKMHITSLTKHTAQVLITTTIDNSNMKNIISMLKEKEHSFLQY